MSTYVFVNLPAVGHINPTLAIVRELVGRGERVVYFVTEEFRVEIETTGAEFRPLPALKTRNSSNTNKAPNDHQIELMSLVMAAQAREAVSYLAEEFRKIEPVCIIYNALSLWARLTAMFLNLPRIALRPYHAPASRRSNIDLSANERLTSLAAASQKSLDELAHNFGMEPQTVSNFVSHSEDLTIVFVPREFQSDIETFHERFHFVGPSLSFSPPVPWPLHSECSVPVSRAYISLGTLRNDMPAFYQSCFEAFSGADWQVVMSVGNRVPITSLGAIPPNFAVVASVPQLSILPLVNVFISHGGLNSVMESLYFGIPLVVVPSIHEQRRTGARISELGLGVVLEHESLAPDSLRASTEFVAREPAIQGQVAKMQGAVRNAGGCLAATNVIREVARRGSLS